MSIILHIAERHSWELAILQGEYRPASLDDEGFIHCSLLEQVVAVANAFYRGRQNLVLLIIDPAKVPGDIRFEDCYETGQEFPHIYGPLPINAVERMIAFAPGPDGYFILPSDLELDR